MTKKYLTSARTQTPFPEPFPALPQVIGRQELVTRMEGYINAPVTSDISRYFIVRDEGGVGKTHLLRSAINSIWRQSSVREYGKHNAKPGEAIFAFVDIQSHDTHTPEGLIEVIVDGLRDFVGNEPFRAYDEALVYLSIILQDPAPHRQQERAQARQWVVDQFCECYERLAQQYRMVLVFDTLEEFERIAHNLYKLLERSPQDQKVARRRFRDTLFDEKQQAEFKLTDVKELLQNRLFQLPRTLYILAGRDRERYPDEFSYHWCLAPDQGGFHFPAGADVSYETLGKLSKEEAQKLLKDLGVGLKELRTVLPRFYDLIGYNPIFLVLLAETYRHDRVTSKDLESREDLEAKLVQRYWHIAVETQLVLYMALGARTYFFDQKMVQAVTQCSPEQAEAKLRRLRQLRFIRVHANGSVSLQDELARLLRQHVWDKQAVEPGKKELEERRVLRLLLHYHLEKWKDVEAQIAEKITQLQNISDPNYVERVERMRASQTDAPLTGMLTAEEREAGQYAIDLLRQEWLSERLVREMEFLLINIGYYPADSFLADHQEVFDCRWKLLRSSYEDQRKSRERLIGRMIDIAFYAVFHRLPTADEKKQSDYEDRYWRGVEPGKATKELDFNIIRIRQKHIRHQYYLEGDYRKAYDCFMELVRQFDPVLTVDKDDTDVGPEEGRVRTSDKGDKAVDLKGAELKAEVLISAGDAATYAREFRNERRLDAYRQALQICDDNGIKRLYSEIYRKIGWSYRMKWQIEEAKRNYQLALDNFNLAKTGVSSPFDLYHDFAIISNNLGYAIRYEDVHTALLLSSAAYRIHSRTRRLIDMMRTLRSLAVIYRLLGNYAKSLECADDAVRLAEQRGDHDHATLGWLQRGFTAWYAAMEATQPANQKHYTNMALESLGQAQQWLDEHAQTTNTPILIEKVRMHYVLAQMAARKKTPDYKRAKAHIADGLRIVEKELHHDPYLLLQNYYEDLRLRQNELRYDADVLKSHRYRQAVRASEELGVVAHSYVGQIEEIAGNVALREALANSNPPRFQQAIEHYARAFTEIASATGYNIVMLKSVLDNLHQRFQALRAAGQSDPACFNVATTWCDYFERALQRNLDELERTKQLKHPRQYDQGFHFVRVERIVIGLLMRHTLAGKIRPAKPNQRALAQAVNILTNAVEGDANRALSQLETLLRVETLEAEPLWQIFHHYYPSLAEPHDAVPQTWRFGSQSWYRFISYLLTAISRQKQLSKELLPLFLKSTAMCHYVPVARAVTKAGLMNVLEFFGFGDNALEIGLQAVEEAYEDGDVQYTLLLLNEISRALARHGDFLSSLVYWKGLAELCDYLTDRQARFEIRMTEGQVYRAWGGVSVERGAPGLVDELYSHALKVFQSAVEHSPPDSDHHREAELERLLTVGYWSNVARWDEKELARLQQAQQRLLQLKTQLGQYHQSRLQADTTLARFFMKHAHKLAQIENKDINQYFRHTREVLLASLEHGRQRNIPYLVIGGLSRLIELDYLRSLDHTDTEIHKTVVPAGTGLSAYQYLQQKDRNMQELMSLREKMMTGFAVGDVTDTLGIKFDFGSMVPEGFRHYYGRVELVSGALAQWSGALDAAIAHYSEAGKLIANSAYSIFNVNLLLSFITTRFLELRNDFRTQEKWANTLLASWEQDEAIAHYYTDLIEFCRLQKRLALLVR